MYHPVLVRNLEVCSTITQFDVAKSASRNGIPIFSKVWPNSLTFDTWIHLDMTFHVDLVWFE